MTVYLLVYSFGRFCVEFLRGDELRGFLLWFSTSQWISICLFVIAVMMLVRRKSPQLN